MKPDKQGPRSRFGRSTEDLTNASKQVCTANVETQDPCWFNCMSVFISRKVRRNIFNRFLCLKLQDVIGVSHSQAPQKPVRRKYHPDGQNLEAAPPPTVPLPTPAKSAQKLVKHFSSLIEILKVQCVQILFKTFKYERNHQQNVK